MIQVTINGKPFSPETLEGAVVGALVEQLRSKLGSIRHPETGEFPTIAVTGGDLDSLRCTVEGSPELIALVHERLSDKSEMGEDAASNNPAPTITTADAAMPEARHIPQAFLSYAFEDSALAEKIADELQRNGINTFWAGWSIASGDSIRQRIDEGLGECTHFLVLLTPNSVSKPWVNIEIDAGLMRKLGAGVKFIPLRCGLAPALLSPLLQTFLSPEVNAISLDVSQVVNDIHGVTRKPTLGQPPMAKTSSTKVNTGYSPAATALAKLFVEESKTGRQFDPVFSPEKAGAKLGLSDDDLTDAVHELNGMVTDHYGRYLFPQEALFVQFDEHWMPWNPADDALRVAAGLINDPNFPDKPAEMASVLGWPARRLNPALAFLCVRGLVADRRYLDGTEFIAHRIDKTDATRRFVRSRS